MKKKEIKTKTEREVIEDIKNFNFDACFDKKGERIWNFSSYAEKRIEFWQKKLNTNPGSK